MGHNDKGKQDAVFRFGRVSHQGTIHLFEHDYDKHFSFWYGVASIACNQEDILKHLVLLVTLADGRIGIATKTDLLADYTAEGAPCITCSLFGTAVLEAAS
jgi:hypothetical protein